MTLSKAAQYALDTRRRRALELRSKGRKLHTIVEMVNTEIAAGDLQADPYADEQHCWQDIQLALTVARERRLAAADAFMDLELEKLDSMEEAVYEVLRTKHYVVNQGMVVYMGQDPERKGNPYSGAKALAEHLREFPLEDDGPILQAVDRLLKIGDQRAKLIGLYAPIKKQVEVSGSVATSDDIRSVVGELAGAGPTAAVGGVAAGAGASPVPDTRSARELLGSADPDNPSS